MKHLTFKNIILLILTSLLLCGCSSTEPISKNGMYFNTVIQVTLYNSSEASLLDGCMDLASYYENLLSKTVEGSDIYRINHSNGDPVTVSSETIFLLETALDYARLSDGKVDPTIGTLSNLWDFTANPPVPPAKEEISQALSHVNYENIVIHENQVTLKDPLAALDLGFIAKGYIADQMSAYLKEEGVKHALINLGGNVLTLGTKPDGSAYTIGIQKPFDATGTPITTVDVSNRSVVSSGVYERYFEYEGKNYHHLLDTTTGYPIENELLSVTILSDSSMHGDALSTTCFALGLQEGMKYIQSLDGVDAIFITHDYQLHTTY